MNEEQTLEKRLHKMDKIDEWICRIFCVLMWLTFFFSLTRWGNTSISGKYDPPLQSLLWWMTWLIIMPSIIIPLTITCLWTFWKK